MSVSSEHAEPTAPRPLIMEDGEYKATWKDLSRAERNWVDRAATRADVPIDDAQLARLVRSRIVKLIELGTLSVAGIGVSLWLQGLAFFWSAQARERVTPVVPAAGVFFVVVLIVRARQVVRLQRTVASWVLGPGAEPPSQGG